MSNGALTLPFYRSNLKADATSLKQAPYLPFWHEGCSYTSGVERSFAAPATDVRSGPLWAVREDGQPERPRPAAPGSTRRLALPRRKSGSSPSVTTGTNLPWNC